MDVLSLIPNVSEESFTQDGEYCKKCSFSESIGASKSDCLMNSIKEKWQSPGVIHYCDDPFAFKFIKLWHLEFTKKRLNLAGVSHKKKL